MSPARRCICGKSRRFPLCDGHHASEGWSCAAGSPRAHERVFAAAPHDHNLAERLAHARGGAALHRLRGPVHTEELILLTDGAELGPLRQAAARVVAPVRRALLLGVDPALVQPALPDTVLVAVPEPPHPALLWSTVAAALDRPPPAAAPVPASSAPRLFLSHATADEPQLERAVAALRRLGLGVFLCADSIPGGARWWDRILAALRATDRFVLVLSAAAARSTWCAFETGTAMAIEKPVQIISLDGTPPPSYAAHLQAQDLRRHRALRPWLDPDDALIGALLAPIPASAPADDPPRPPGPPAGDPRDDRHPAAPPAEAAGD